MGTCEVCHPTADAVSLPAPGRADERPSDREVHFLRHLVLGMRCGVLAVDRGGRLVMMNDPAVQILNLAAAPSPGTPLAEALPDLPELTRVLRESFRMTQLPNRAELELRPDKTGGKTIGFTISLVPGKGSRASGAAIFFKDLTQIEHREEQERLRDRLAALGQMSAAMAHEIRNPLASIEVTGALLKRRLGATPAVAELVDKIAAEVRRLNGIVRSSLEFVKPLRLELEREDLAAVLEEAIVAASTRGVGNRTPVTRRFEQPLPGFLMDRGRLRQVFENLLVNAFEAAGPAGRLEVEAGVLPAPSGASVPYGPAAARARDPWQTAEQFAVVRISDSGPGVPREQRDRIFYPFFTTKKQGSGVGLSVVKKIVDSHHGSIDVDRALLGGARFTIRLPMIFERAGD